MMRSEIHVCNGNVNDSMLHSGTYYMSKLMECFLFYIFAEPFLLMSDAFPKLQIYMHRICTYKFLSVAIKQTVTETETGVIVRRGSKRKPRVIQ